VVAPNINQRSAAAAARHHRERDRLIEAIVQVFVGVKRRRIARSESPQARPGVPRIGTGLTPSAAVLAHGLFREPVTCYSNAFRKLGGLIPLPDLINHAAGIEKRMPVRNSQPIPDPN
jgi:hypothetical protein